MAGSPSVQPVGWADSNDQWTRIVVPELTIAPTHSSITIYATNNAGGTVCFDDLFIAELPENHRGCQWQRRMNDYINCRIGCPRSSIATMSRGMFTSRRSVEMSKSVCMTVANR